MINIDKIICESIDEEIYNARNSVNTNPTEKQKKAGNYKKGHVTVNGFKISIENPKGSYRRGKTKKGKEWSVQMPHDYGYFVRTKGKDGDAIDVFIGDSLESEKIYVVDQKLHGTFDESKVMFCFDSIEDAKQGYMDSYEEGWKGFWKITPVSLPVFKKWLYDGRKQRKPFYDYVEIIKHNKKEKKKMKLTENTLREIVRKYINESINEGTPWETDGKFRYQGTGSPESKKRVQKMRFKTNPDEPAYGYDNEGKWGKNNKRDFFDKALHDKNRNNMRIGEVGRSYDDKGSTENGTEYAVLRELSKKITEVIEDTFRGRQKEGFKFTKEAENIVSNIEKLTNNLEYASKRDWSGKNRN